MRWDCRDSWLIESTRSHACRASWMNRNRELIMSRIRTVFWARRMNHSDRKICWSGISWICSGRWMTRWRTKASLSSRQSPSTKKERCWALIRSILCSGSWTRLECSSISSTRDYKARAMRISSYRTSSTLMCRVARLSHRARRFSSAMWDSFHRVRAACRIITLLISWTHFLLLVSV